MSSFEKIELDAPSESEKPSSPPVEPSADNAAAEGSKNAAERSTPGDSTSTPPVVATPPADAASPSSQAAAALQSVFGFLGGNSAAAEQREETPQPDKGTRAPTGGAGGAEPGAPVADPVAEFEREALDAAIKAEEAVKEVGANVADAAGQASRGAYHLLTACACTARPLQVGQKLLHGAAEAKDSIASLAQGFSSWWSKLDPAAEGSGGGGGGAGSSSGAVARPQDVQQAAQSLGLEAGETVLESFACQLLQTYTCSSNSLTPVRQASLAVHAVQCMLCPSCGVLRVGHEKPCNAQCAVVAPSDAGFGRRFPSPAASTSPVGGSALRLRRKGWRPSSWWARPSSWWPRWQRTHRQVGCTWVSTGCLLGCLLGCCLQLGWSAAMAQPRLRCPPTMPGVPERLELQLAEAGQRLVLAHFALADMEMDSALALLEHLAEDSG